MRGGQGEWKPIGGQAVPVGKPLTPSKTTQPDESVIPGVPSKSGPSAGTGPVVFQKDRLTIAFTPGSRAVERLQVARVKAFPPIQGTAEERKACQELQLVGDAWEIRDLTGTVEPYEIELRFDPADARGKNLILLAVSDGRVWLPRVFAADPNEGYVIAEGDHFSTLGVVVVSAMVATLLGVAYQSYAFVSNEMTPWVLIEPGNQKIKEFIKKNKLALPSMSPGTERVELANYNRVFEEREDTAFNRVVHLTGKRGSAVLDETKVACWDLTTLFASILYTMDPDIPMRLVKGTADGGRHSWIEVVIDGQVFVVNTGAKGLTAFEFVARDVLYRQQKLKPGKSYTKDAGSLGNYDPDWFKLYLGADGKTQAKIDALKARHAALQVELQQLAALGTSIRPEDEARMDAIRTEQRQIYQEVLTLQKTLSR